MNSECFLEIKRQAAHPEPTSRLEGVGGEYIYVETAFPNRMRTANLNRSADVDSTRPLTRVGPREDAEARQEGKTPASCLPSGTDD